MFFLRHPKCWDILQKDPGSSCQTTLWPTHSLLPVPSPLLFDRWRLIFSSQLTEDKGTSPSDCRHYLQMWAKEKEVQKETIKDLPRMNQVGPTRPAVCAVSMLAKWGAPLAPPESGILLPTSGACHSDGSQGQFQKDSRPGAPGPHSYSLS